MYKHWYMCALVSINISFFEMEARKVATPPQAPTSELKQLVEKLYEERNISGFSIDGNEAKAITDVGGAPTYGEIVWDSLAAVLNDLKIKPSDVFYDLGSGVGKVAIQTYLTTPVRKSVGVELSTTRHNHAVTIAQELKKLGHVAPSRILAFHNENITEVPLDDATIVFMCSTCFSDDLMKTILNNLKKAKKGLRILTLRQLPRDPHVILEKTYSLPMTWSSSTPVYLYKKVS